MKEYKLGQIVTIKGTKCRVTKSNGDCDGCAHRNSSGHCDDDKGEHKCIGPWRSDHTNIIFKPIPSAHKDVNSALGESIQSEFPLPPENMRVWIRGNKERGEEVIKALTDLGAKNNFKHHVWNEDAIFFIDKNNEVDSTVKESTLAAFIANFYKEIKLPYKPKDKELVWAWDENFHFGKMLMFYDSKNRRSFNTVLGNRIGYRHDHYAPYEGDWPQWAKEAVKKLED